MKIYCILLFLIPYFAFAQQADTLQNPSRHEQQVYPSNKIKPFLIPTVLIAYGAISLGNNPIKDLDLSTQAELSEDHPRFAAHVDDYIQYSPLVAVYGLHALGIKNKHTVLDQTAMAFISIGITTAFVTTLKNQTHRLRPNGAGYNSFPSGHTATAFASAEILNQEFKDQSPWYGYAGYTVATATGVLRMYNNKHWLSDVVAGAGVGILSTKLSYLIYPKLKHLLGAKQTNLLLVPAYQNGTVGFTSVYGFKH